MHAHAQGAGDAVREQRQNVMLCPVWKRTGRASGMVYRRHGGSTAWRRTAHLCMPGPGTPARRAPLHAARPHQAPVCHIIHPPAHNPLLPSNWPATTRTHWHTWGRGAGTVQAQVLGHTIRRRERQHQHADAEPGPAVARGMCSRRGPHVCGLAFVRACVRAWVCDARRACASIPHACCRGSGATACVPCVFGHGTARMACTRFHTPLACSRGRAESSTCRPSRMHTSMHARVCMHACLGGGGCAHVCMCSCAAGMVGSTPSPPPPPPPRPSGACAAFSHAGSCPPSGCRGGPLVSHRQRECGFPRHSTNSNSTRIWGPPRSRLARPGRQHRPRAAPAATHRRRQCQQWVSALVDGRPALQRPAGGGRRPRAQGPWRRRPRAGL